MNTKELGDFGESLACEYLVNKGFKIVGRNYRITFGEIDIIARKKLAPLNKICQILNFGSDQSLFNGVKKFLNRDNVIHFVEVKTSLLGNEMFLPEERVNFKKQRKLQQLCQIWIEQNKYQQNHPYQIDVIGILVNEETRKAKLHYFGNVIEDK